MSKPAALTDAQAPPREWAEKFQADLSVLSVSMGLKLTKRQTEIMQIMSKPGAWLAARTCHGIGKSYSAAALVCAFLVSFPGAKVISTAPTNAQVRDILWVEINQMVRNSPMPLGGDCKVQRWDIEAGWFAVGLATRESENIQGRHGDHILFVLDEAAGIRPEIWLAIRSMTTGADARCLAIGNPTRRTGDFAACFKDPRWQKLHIGWREAPNITGERFIPGGATQAWVEDMAQKFGRKSAIYLSRVEAEFPEDDADMIIPWSWIASAQEPSRGEQARPNGDRRLGVDVARFGSAFSVLTFRDGPRIEARERYQGTTIPELARHVRVMAEANRIEAGCVVIDDTGVGGGVVDLLNEWWAPAKVRAFKFGGKPDDEGHFKDAATEIYWRVRQALDPERPDPLALPADDLLADDLLRKHGLTDKGKMKIESKDDFQKRNPAGRSPDDGDSLALTFARPEPRPADYEAPWGDDKEDNRVNAAIKTVFSERHGEDVDEEDGEEEDSDGGFK